MGSKIAVLVVLAGAACLGLFAVLGSSVAPDGRLQEPFALLPLGWALILLGGAGLAVSRVRRVLQERGQPHE